MFGVVLLVELSASRFGGALGEREHVCQTGVACPHFALPGIELPEWVDLPFEASKKPLSAVACSCCAISGVGPGGVGRHAGPPAALAWSHSLVARHFPRSPCVVGFLERVPLRRWHRSDGPSHPSSSPAATSSHRCRRRRASTGARSCGAIPEGAVEGAEDARDIAQAPPAPSGTFQTPCAGACGLPLGDEPDNQAGFHAKCHPAGRQ